MLVQLTNPSRKVLMVAAEEATQLGYKYIGAEHILLGLIGQETGIPAKVFHSMGINLKGAREEVEKLVGRGGGTSGSVVSDLQLTLGANRVLRLSFEESRQLGCYYIASGHLLLGLLLECDNVVTRVIENQHGDVNDIRKQVTSMGDLSAEVNEIQQTPSTNVLGSNILSQEVTRMAANSAESYGINFPGGGSGKERHLTPALDVHGTNLTKLAQQKKLNPFLGRKEQVDSVIQTLCRRSKSNPCLIGEPGVGKTAIVEGLAQRIANGDVPKNLKGKKVISLNMANLLSGTNYRGVFEERIRSLLKETEQSGDVILFIDEVHTLIGAGRTEKSTLDAANILKPALARNDIQCIGATTLDEYRNFIDKDPALERRFQPVQVPEPSVDDTIQILKGIRETYEAQHEIHYTDEALVAAAKLSYLYIRDRFLPDKAIDLIDEAGSHVQLRHAQYTRAIGGNDIGTSTPTVTEVDIQNIVSSWTGIPIQKVSSEESACLLKMEETLHKYIIGQDEAVNAISRAIRRSRAGLRSPKKPIASFLFTASKFIGTAPGYRGYEEGGQLTEAVRRRPHTVVLFDEIEKAHPDVLNLMLQVLDDGRLTDSKGRTVYFNNTIIIMTSNVGSSIIDKRSGCSDFVDILDQHDEENSEYKKKDRVIDELRNRFRPEFLNRFDELIVFKQLTKLEVKQIAELMVKEVSDMLQAKDIQLEVTDGFKHKVVEEGYNPSFGVRQLRRTITKLLEDNLAEKVLTKEIKEGHSVVVDVDSGGNVLLLNQQNAVTNGNISLTAVPSPSRGGTRLDTRSLISYKLGAP
ncbi:ATP-dependent Clp protease ATP-binding subunit ClpA-like, chloroplastic [Quillaja saponaria]|uniref:ATP-dependent Clp protease ATP-binding subunit ClpA-like, chloroplastic n=1 Tax=Quillaja saponaria TaxID=32244 RepID=A0AAD7PMG7_QUISA|nr:ATP-dependent Clp protease ATP-binding subunit ClpA-like, chloroplastic [Quillaja saponaria]